MSISEISIRRPVFAWMLMFALIFFGSLGYKKMGVSQLPDVDFPIVNIRTSMEGASPDIMEEDVIDPIESAVMGVQGILNVSSTARTGSANITVEFDINKNIDLAVQEIQNVISRVTHHLPKEVEAPTVSKSNPEDQPIIWLTVTSNTMSRRDLMALVRDRIQDRFSTVDGVGEISLGGYLEPNLRVWVSNKKLNKKYLSINDILNTISAEHSEKPSGRVENTTSEFNIRTMGEAMTSEEFSKLSINRLGGGINYSPIALGSVARIENGLEDERQLSRVMGVSAVGLGIKKQRGSNAVAVAQAVKTRMNEIKLTLPKGTEIGVRFDMTTFIEESIRELNFTLIFSAILTALVCWLFLGSFSATINVVLAIPTSIIGSFIVLYALGFTLNTFTLLGLSLAIGVVVDDAIMVLENIVRHMEGGKKKRAAALIGTAEITLAAMATTAAIVAIFFPVAYMKGIIGKFFFQFGITITAAVLFSLLEALTLTPMRCSAFLDVSERTSLIGRSVEWCFKKVASSYKIIIPKILNHRLLTLLTAIILFALSLALIPKIPKEFTPPQDQGRLMLRLQAPVGSSLALTDSKVKEVEKEVSLMNEVDQYFTTVGGMGGGDVNSGMIFITLKPLNDRGIDPKLKRPPTQQEFAVELRARLKKITSMKVKVQDPSLGGFSAKRGYPIEFSVKGPDWQKLIEYSQAIMEKMSESDHMTDVDTNYLSGMPEIQVIPDRQKAMSHGVSISDITATINATMGGVVAGKFSKDGHRYDVRVRLEGDERASAEDIKNIMVRNNRGELIALSKVVTIKKAEGMQLISREDRERAIIVYANLALKASQDKALDEVQQIAKEILPENYHISISGSAKTFRESFIALIMALVLGIIVAYMVLASQFNSFIHPFTVLTALPFALSGALAALYFTHLSINIYSMIGIILLMGLVKKNSIMLVDFTNKMRERGMNVREALIEACPIRIRPILMTSIATIVGALPPALALGPGAESRIPMAVVVLGGIIFSTLLTLFVVPCLYSILSNLQSKKSKEVE
ncbi:MAG: efflux RND transporter permease subunit [Oligoflexia bacterium]|nr:efflux RND transporter permease subunit [Oligoflexia bacterium]